MIDESKLDGHTKLMYGCKEESYNSRAVEGKTSHWLTVLPTFPCHFDLPPIECRDACYCKIITIYINALVID